MIPATRYIDSRFRHREHGLCLIWRGGPGFGAAGSCFSASDVIEGHAFGALAGKVYGVVADGVIAVRDRFARRWTAVRDNSFIYAAPGRGGRIYPPALRRR